MALDPTKVTGKSTALLTKRTEAFEDAAADLNLAVLRIDETSPDPDTAKHRVKVAKAVLSGDETSVRQAVFGDLSDDDRHVIEEVFSGRLTKANLDQLRQQSAQAAQPAAQQPQQPQIVQGNVVTPSQEVIDTVNETATLASNGATAAKEAKEELAKLKEELDNLSAVMNLGAKKQILKIYNSAVAKVAAAESAANNTKNKAEEAKTKASQAGSGNAAPATQAIPAAPNP